MRNYKKSALAIVAASVLAAQAPWANAQISTVGITVRLETKSKRDGSSIYTHNDDRQLVITLQNQTGRAIEAATVKYYLFAKDMEKKQVVVAGRGEKQITLPAGTPAQISSEPVATSYVEEHSEGSRRSSKRIPASGQKYCGYGVQVMADGKLLGQQFTPSHLQSQTDAAPAKTDAPAKKQDQGGKKKEKK